MSATQSTAWHIRRSLQQRNRSKSPKDGIIGRPGNQARPQDREVSLQQLEPSTLFASRGRHVFSRGHISGRQCPAVGVFIEFVRRCGAASSNELATLASLIGRVGRTVAQTLLSVLRRSPFHVGRRPNADHSSATTISALKKASIPSISPASSPPPTDVKKKDEDDPPRFPIRGGWDELRVGWPFGVWFFRGCGWGNR